MVIRINCLILTLTISIRGQSSHIAAHRCFPVGRHHVTFIQNNNKAGFAYNYLYWDWCDVLNQFNLHLLTILTATAPLLPVRVSNVLLCRLTTINSCCWLLSGRGGWWLLISSSSSSQLDNLSVISLDWDLTWGLPWGLYHHSRQNRLQTRLALDYECSLSTFQNIIFSYRVLSNIRLWRHKIELQKYV